jgi:hypothetical protein
MLSLILLQEELVVVLGRIAALVLTLYLFIFALFFMVAALLLLFGNAWLQDKVDLLRNLRLLAGRIDTAMHVPSGEMLPAVLEPDDALEQAIRAIHTVQSVQVVQKVKDAQKQASAIEKTVDQGTDRIASAVIEFRARTVMVQGMLKAFFLPGLTKQKPPVALLPQARPDSLIAESSAVAAAVPDSSDRAEDRQIQPIGAGQPKPLMSEGTGRADDAPGR